MIEKRREGGEWPISLAEPCEVWLDINLGVPDKAMFKQPLLGPWLSTNSAEQRSHFGLQRPSIIYQSKKSIIGLDYAVIYPRAIIKPCHKLPTPPTSVDGDESSTN